MFFVRPWKIQLVNHFPPNFPYWLNNYESIMPIKTGTALFLECSTLNFMHGLSQIPYQLVALKTKSQF